jgi:signal transduction histidine kinase
MTLQAKLTLGTVLLTTGIVTVVSAVGLVNILEIRFQTTLREARTVLEVSVSNVTEASRSHPDFDISDALATSRLADQLKAQVGPAKEIVEVAVVDPQNEILADSTPERRGDTLLRYDSLETLVNKTGWYQKVQLLSAHNASYYQLEREMGPPQIFVRVVVAPAFIREYMATPLRENADTAITCEIGAIILTFLFSAFAFRPLGRLRRQLDLLASGEYEPQAAKGVVKPSTDELSIMSSKVSLLGERLRGAQFEVSDLRGNIDRLMQELEDAVLIFNRDGRLVFASGSVAKFLGKDRETLSGASIAEVFPPASNLGFLIAQASATGMMIRNRRIPLEGIGDGGRPENSVLLWVDPLQDQAGGLLVRLRDPEAQRQIGRQLQTADRLAAISRISGGVAHEVKNPLNAILLHVEVAKARLKKGEADVTPQMEVISREILRLDRVVKTFLDFTRPVELKYVTVPLKDMLNELVELARPQAEAEKIRMVVELAAEDVDVKLDRDMFKQALLNVLVNAMQAMKGGGELKVQSVAAEDTVEIRISDTGPGIPPELREKIFRLYFTTKQGGSGIGLAMTFRIVQLHDGTIDFSSEPGKGTTFAIRLPIAV